MNENEKMLTVAKVLWIIGIAVEIGILSYPLFLHSAHMRKLIGYPPMPLIASLEVACGILVLISVGIITGIFQKAKPFYLLLAAVLTKFTWMLLQKPISNYLRTMYRPSQQGVISMIWKVLLLQMLPEWIIKIVIAVLVLIAFFEIARFSGNNLFKQSGILILTGTLIFVAYGPINYALDIHNYISSRRPAISAQTINRILSIVNLTYFLFTIIALIILIAAVLQIKVPQHNKAESITA